MQVLGVNGSWISIWSWFEYCKCLDKPSECEEFGNVCIVVPSTIVVDKQRSSVVESVVGVRGARDSESTVDEDEVEQFVCSEWFDAVLVCCCIVENGVAEPGGGSNVGVSQFDSLVELVVFYKHCCVLVPLQ